MAFFDHIKKTFRRLQWKLTLAFTAVTMGSLLMVVLIAGSFLFLKVLVPLNILNSVLSPRAWIQTVSSSTPPEWGYILSQEPVDTHLLSLMLKNNDLQVTYFDLFQIGDLQVRVRTAAEGSVLLVDPDGILLGTSNPGLVPPEAVGKSLDRTVLPGLEVPLETALNGIVDPDLLFVTIEPNERFYFAIPYLDHNEQEVLGVGIIYFESLPTENDLPENVFALLTRSVLILLLAAGLIGTLFGALTANGMVRRLQHVSDVTDAWSQGDFSEFIDDPLGDEISHLAIRLNNMAEQLQHYLKRSQEMAVSEERNRLARDLHDSAKQEALAASFHLGTAMTLLDLDPESARDHLVEADNLLNSVRTELTDLIHELRPPSMNGAQFDETLNEYIIEWAHQAGISANFDVQGDDDLPLEIKQSIYRITQEALANVARHSAASSVDVTLSYQENVVCISITDDGIGFNTYQQLDGMGLDSMRERAESFNGDFRIESEPNKGTKIIVALPFKS